MTIEKLAAIVAIVGFILGCLAETAKAKSRKSLLKQISLVVVAILAALLLVYLTTTTFHSAAIPQVPAPQPTVGSPQPAGSAAPLVMPPAVTVPPKSLPPDRGGDGADSGETLPVAFNLANGEQRVLFSGAASVAVEFSMVGEMPVMTLHLSSSAGNEPKTVLNAGARFPLLVGSQKFCVSVVGMDFTSQKAQLQVDRTDQCGR